MKHMKTLFTTILFMTLFTITAFASSKITSVSVSIKESKAEAGQIYEAEPSVSSSFYELASCEVSKDYGSWKPGSKITYTITLEPKEGYRFDTSKIKKISVSNGEIASKSVKSGKIELRINYIPKITLESPANIYFEDEYLAVWDKVEYCKLYEVQIMKENDNGDFRNYKTEKVSKPEIDLSSYATDEYGITFKVRAIAKDSSQSKYLKSSEWVSADDSVTSDENTSYGRFSGSGENITFRTENGSASGWQLINGSWYYFDPGNHNKARVSSWQKINEKWYHFNEYGIMQTGWILLDGYWYYLNPLNEGVNGAMLTGWLKSGPNGPWYYLQPGVVGPLPEGAMFADRITPDGYYVDPSGAWY